jgi:hypothetical protein
LRRIFPCKGLNQAPCPYNVFWSDWLCITTDISKHIPAVIIWQPPK